MVPALVSRLGGSPAKSPVQFLAGEVAGFVFSFSTAVVVLVSEDTSASEPASSLGRLPLASCVCSGRTNEREQR